MDNAIALENAALERKAKLKALKEKKEKAKGNEKPKLKFRSYNPLNENLKESKLPKAKPEDVEPQIQEQLEAAKNSDLGEINLSNLAPKKPDWDLKRDIKQKMDKLERRTQRAIVELIHERLKDSNGGSDLASAVAQAGKDEPNNDSD